MSSEINCTVDSFARTMENLLSDVSSHTEDALEKATRKAAQKGRREWAKNAKASFKGTGRYAKGVSYKVSKSKDGIEAQIGNKDVPGLAHLLEKGHAKVGGGRVPGREHIAPAAEDAFDEFNKTLKGGLRKL